MNRENIARIIQLERDASKLASEADAARWQAAELIARELETTTQRALAKAIGKSQNHVGRCARAWRAVETLGSQDRPPFNELYHSPAVRGPAAAKAGRPAKAVTAARRPAAVDGAFVTGAPRDGCTCQPDPACPVHWDA